MLEVEASGQVGPDAVNRLFQVIYDELHDIASSLIRRERPDHTLRPTALVHEVYLRLVDESQLSWGSRAHFFGIAARAMREILVSHARRKAALKRGGGWRRVTFDGLLGDRDPFFEILAVDEALSRLSALDERTGRVAELRLMAGLTMDEVAHILGVSRRTADGDWAMARKWLSRELA